MYIKFLERYKEIKFSLGFIMIKLARILLMQTISSTFRTLYSRFDNLDKKMNILHQL